MYLMHNDLLLTLKISTQRIDQLIQHPTMLVITWAIQTIDETSEKRCIAHKHDINFWPYSSAHCAFTTYTDAESFQHAQLAEETACHWYVDLVNDFSLD